MRKQGQEGGLRIAVAGLAALAVAMGVGRFAFTPILPMMQQDAGLSVAAGGWLASANYVGYLVGALWAGAARVNAALAIRAGLSAIVLSTLAMAFDAGFFAWALLRAVAGIASAWVLIHLSAWSFERLAPFGRPILPGVLFAGIGTGVAVVGLLCVLMMAMKQDSSEAWLVLGVASAVITAVLWPRFDTSHGKAAAPKKPHLWTWEQVRFVVAYGTYGLGYIIPATFLPVMAKDIVSDPAVFGWVWPAFGVAAVLSTLGVALLAGRFGNRTAWIGCHVVMALGVASPVLWPGLGGIVLAAVCVGGTFVVMTMVGLQVAREVAGAQAPRLMAAMTSAFAAGQIAGPLSVSVLAGARGAGGGFTVALLVACAALIGGALLLVPRSR